MKIRLIPIEGGNPIDLVRDITVIGRKEDCDLRLDSKSVSKFHCVIVKNGDKIHIRDLGSTNGTRVNGQRIRRASLNENDSLTIANIPFKIMFSHGNTPGPMNAIGCTVQIRSESIDEEIEKQNSDSERIHQKDFGHRNELPDVYPTSP